MLTLLSILVASPAIAGSGPWTISEGDTSIYAGVESQRLERLTLSSGAGADDVLDVDDGLETTGTVMVVTHGIRQDIEFQVNASWMRVQANRPDGELCAALGPQTCKTTRGLAPMGVQVKWQIVDELVGAPLSMSIGGAARFSQWTARTRDRTTNLGEGTTDFGPTLALGRSGGLGEGFWSAHVDTSWLYRQSNIVDSDPPVPGSELKIDTEALGGTRTWWSVGPTISYWERPQGVDLEDILADPNLATDIDRFARLRARSVRVGGKLLIRSSERTTLVLAGFTTVAAVNNPLVSGLSAGFGFYPRPANQRVGVSGAN